MKLQTRALLFLLIPLTMLALYQFNSYDIVIGQVEKQVHLADSMQHITDLAVNVRYLTLLNARESNLAALHIVSGDYEGAQKDIVALRGLKKQRLEYFENLKGSILAQNDPEKAAQIAALEETFVHADAKDSEVLAMMAELPKTSEGQQLIVEKKTKELDLIESKFLMELDAIIESNFLASQVASSETSASLQNGLSALHVFSITTFLVVLLVVLFLNSLTINSIGKISSAVEEITKGKFDIELEQSNIYEIQALTNSFNRVLASMKLAILRSGTSKDDIGISGKDALQATVREIPTSGESTPAPKQKLSKKKKAKQVRIQNLKHL